MCSSRRQPGTPPPCSTSRSEEHTSELRHVEISYAVFCLKKKKRRRYRAARRSLDSGADRKGQALRTQGARACDRGRVRQDRRAPVLRLCPDGFFLNGTATTEIYTLSLHDALPI